MSVPDQVGPAGGDTVAVARVQRSEVWLLKQDVEEAALRFQVADMTERGAYTDKLGYAGTTVPLPEKPGRYEMSVSYLDRYGDEAVQSVPAFAWPAEAKVAAVELDVLNFGKGTDRDSAALQKIAQNYRIIYMTEEPVSEHRKIHKKLADAGYPQGPVLPWKQKKWHLVFRGRFRVPRILIEDRLVSQLDTLKDVFPNLSAGIAESSSAAATFQQAGLAVAIVGGASAPSKARVQRAADLQELADEGLDAGGENVTPAEETVESSE